MSTERDEDVIQLSLKLQEMEEERAELETILEEAITQRKSLQDRGLEKDKRIAELERELLLAKAEAEWLRGRINHILPGVRVL